MIKLHRVWSFWWRSYSWSKESQNKVINFVFNYNIYSVFSQVPSVLEFASYNFNFITFLAGPSCPYKEYIDFITGDNIVLQVCTKQYTYILILSFQSKGRVHQIHKPSPLYPAIAKCVNAFTCLTVYVILGRYFSMKLIQGKILYIIVYFFLFRS